MNKNIFFAFIAAGFISMATKELPAQTFIGRQTPKIENRTLTPELLWAMGRIGSYDVSPDGRHVAYNVSYYSVEENKSHTVIYATTVVDGRTGATPSAKQDSSKPKAQLLTTSKSSELSPKFLHGSRHITYLAADSKGVMQLWMMNADGTERRQLSNGEKDIEDYAFSPNAKRVLVIHSVKAGASTTDRHPDLPKATGRVIDEAMFRHWDEWTDQVPQPFIYDFDGTELNSTPIRILGDEPFECPMKPFGGIEQLDWSPNSQQVAYTCRKKTGREYAISTDSDIFLYDIPTGTTTNLCKPADYQPPKDIDFTRSLKEQPVNAPIKEGKDYNLGYDTNPKFSPNGQYIAWQSMERDGYESDRNRLCIYEVATGKKTYVTETLETNVDGFCWADDNSTLYFVATWHGTTHVYATTLKGSVQQITGGQYDYTSVALCGQQLLCGRQSMKESPELYLVNPKKPAKNERDVSNVAQLTHENQYFRDNIDWGDVQPRWSKSVDGKEILSWMVLPPHFDASRKYPALLFCEGGPQSPVSQFWSYRWNMQIMAANGYIVVAPNRRGLPGFGTEWLEEISTNYTGRCMDDYKSAIDDVAQLPYVDAGRLGCVGASFGGFSVYWLAGNHDGRFKCFIAHDGIYNLEQQYAETEEAWFTNWDLGGAPWHKDDPAIQRTYANSPHLFIEKWDTPILCIHGEKDYRIVSSQAMAAFNAARYRGVPAQLLIFPDENHWVLKPQNGVLWQRTFFNWLDRWLKK